MPLKVNFFYVFCVIIVFNVSILFAQPINDKCAAAIAVTPSTDCSPVNATLSQATVDAGYALNDVWFSFVATETSHSINVNKTKDLIGSKVFKPEINLYDACGGTKLTSLPLDNTTVGNVPNPQNHIERTFTGLTIGKTYYYRVYNANAGNEFEFNTSVCIFKNLGNINDLVANAIELPVTQTCNFLLYSLAKATKSSPEKTITAVSNPAFQFSDVWFKAKVEANGRLSVIIENVGIDGLEAIAMYTSPDNGVTLTEVSSDYSSGGNGSPITMDKSGLTPGSYVYIRVCATNVNALLGTFNICVSTPPDCGTHTAAGDNCSAPTRICDLNGYCGNTSSSYTIDLPGGTSQQDSKFGGASIENNSWLSFIASATSASFTVYVNNCKPKTNTANGIQIGVFEGNCASIVPKSTFWSPGYVDNTVIKATNLTVGNEYFIMIDGASGANCDYIFATNSGIQLVDAGPDQTYCNPNTNPLELKATGTGTSTLKWSSRAGNVYTPNIGTTAALSVNPGPTVDTRYIIEATGTCTGTKDSLLATISNCLCVKPTINSHPIPVTTCPGSTVNFSMSVTGATSYLWKMSTDGGNTFVNVPNTGIFSGGTSANLVLTGVTSDYNTYQFKCIIKDITGFCSDSTNAATLTITPLTTITTSTLNVCKGDYTTLKATNSPVVGNTYQWTVPSGVVNPGNVNTFSATTPGEYVCNIFSPSNLLCNSDFENYTSTGIFVNSNVSTNCWETTASDNKIEIWTSNPSPYSGSKFIELNATQQSTLFQKINLNAGSTVDISFAHRGRQGTDSVKVLIGLVGGTSTKLGIFGTSNTAWKVYNVSYSVPTTGQYNLQFVSQYATPDKTYGNFLDAVTVKTGLCAVATSKITLLNDPLPTVTVSNDLVVCKNESNTNVVFTGANGTPSYIFTYSINGGPDLTSVSSGSSSTIPVDTSKEGFFIYTISQVKDSKNCKSTISPTIKVQVDSVSVGGQVSTDHSVCIGSKSNLLTLTGYIGNVTKWQYSVSPYTTWKDTAITTTSFTSAPLTQSTKFRAVVKSGSCPEAYATPALVSVDLKSVAGTLNSSKTICAGATSGALTLTGNGTTIQKWQSSISPFTTWTDIANTTTNYTSGVLNDSIKYRVLVKSGVCPTDTSNKITISVNPNQTLNLQCGNTTNTTVQFTWDKIPGVTYYDFSFTIDNLGAPITGKISSNTVDTIITVGGMGQTVNFTLTPVGVLCLGPETANCISTTCLTPKTDQLVDIEVCAGDNIDIPAFTSSDSPESFSWTNSNTAIGLAKNGITDTLFQTALVTKQEIGIIKVNAYKNPCKGPTMTFKITVNPLPIVTTKADTSICKGASLALKGAGATTYAWDNGINDQVAFAPTTTKTYTVTGTDAKSCKNKASVTVTVNDLPVISVSNTGPICANDTLFKLDQAGSILTKWSWKSDASAKFSDSLIKQPIVKKAINNEIFTLVGVDANGCKASATTKLTINPLPVFSISGNSPCEKQTITLFCSSASATTYAWSHKNGYTNSQQNPTLSNCQLSDSGYYYLKFTNNNGCSKIDSVFVSVKTLPDFTPTAISPCESTPFSVTANYANATSYTWTGPSGVLPSGNTETVLVSNNAVPVTHNGDYSVTVTDSKNCSDTKKVTVTVKPSPVITVSNNGPLCANDTTLSLDQAGDVLTSWSWKSNLAATFDDSLIKQPKLKKVANGEIFTLKGFDANGCSATATTTLTVNPLPVFTVSATTPCVGGTLDLSCDLAGAKTYAWSHKSGYTSSSQNTSKVGVVLADTGAYRLVVTDAANCMDTHIVYVKINSLPEFSPSYLPPCAEKPLIIKANYTSAALVKKYEWSTPNTVVDKLTPSENTTITQKSDPKIHNGEYALTITDVNNCLDTKKILVSINPLPAVKSVNDFSICFGDEVTLKGSGAVTYAWDKNIIDNNPFKPLATTTYIVKGTDGNSCQNSDTITVTVNPLPSLTIPELCETFDEVLVSNHKPASANAWVSSDPSVATINATSGKVLGMIAGKSNITFTDSAGCKIIKELIVNATPSITNASLSVCEKSQLTLKANQTGALVSPWKSTAKNCVIDSNSGQVLGLKAGTDSVSFTNNKGCKISKLFTVYGLPMADFTSIDAICIDDTLQLINKTTPVCDSYLWDFGDGTTSKFPSHKFNKGGTFDIALTAIDSHGCQDSIVKLKQVHVVTKPNVTFTFTPDSIDVINPEINFKANSDGNYFKWNFGDGLPTSNKKDPIHFFPTEEGKYYTITLTASNTKEGCSSTYTQVIPAKEPLIFYIPNTFTPNGDEVNNTFQPIFSSGLDPYSYNFYIYNRWGELLFESHNVLIGWDGTYNNQVVGDNTYVWKLEFREKLTGREHTRIGHVNVIR